MVLDIGIECGSNPASVPVLLTNQIFKIHTCLIAIRVVQATGEVRVALKSSKC